MGGYAWGALLWRLVWRYIDLDMRDVCMYDIVQIQ